MLLGFKSRFIEPIQKGTKVFTMRGARKVEPKIGETLYMYSGLRTKNTVKISDKEKLISKQQAIIAMGRHQASYFLSITVDKNDLTKEQVAEFVRFDGFTDEIDFCKYWFENSKSETYPGKIGRYVSATLTIYHWTDLKY